MKEKIKIILKDKFLSSILNNFYVIEFNNKEIHFQGDFNQDLIVSINNRYGGSFDVVSNFGYIEKTITLQDKSIKVYLTEKLGQQEINVEKNEIEIVLKDKFISSILENFYSIAFSTVDIKLQGHFNSDLVKTISEMYGSWKVTDLGYLELETTIERKQNGKSIEKLITFVLT